jgi:multidrug resistance efflux pump
VTTLSTGVGEQAVVGRPVLTLADTSGWLFETTDITELDVLRVTVGAPVVINVAALPDQPIDGVVERVRARGLTGAGGVRFDVIIRPTSHHPQLRWNMSASVRILPSD